MGEHILSATLGNGDQVFDRAILCQRPSRDGRDGCRRTVATMFAEDPQWLKSLSFATKVPGCGPINGTITPSAVVNAVAGDIGASVGGQTLDRTLTVRPISVKTLTLSPNSVVGGNEVTGTVTLDCDAAPQDLAVALSSTKPAIAQPSVPSLLFPMGTQTLMFSIATNSVPVTTSATIKASAKGISKGKKLTVTVP